MAGDEHTWWLAGTHARSYLRRFPDAWTRNHSEDLAQEVALTAWQWGAVLREPRCLWGAVRTIARRLRSRALVDTLREQRARESIAAVRDRAEDESAHWVAGHRVPLHRLLPCVERALARLGPTDRRLLLDFHAGFCCTELSLRSALSESAVKTRIHRARRRVRREIEACVRAADDLDFPA
ncbi:MAG: sigma-70 family RNA polymerase sigma factor [Planctomycetes bacterium]|nr:sigma-70 family RNA polymerase sigma factor [Planctomycetota bacterium]